MGLDIAAYEKVDLVEAMTVKQYNDSGCDRVDEAYVDGVAGLTFLYQESVFAPRCDGLVGGIYRPSGKCVHFRAGSYSGYNHWRDRLSVLMLDMPAAIAWARRDTLEAPFVELINFSDCEGFIGPKTSAKLAADFREAAGKAAALDGPDDGYWLSKYREWAGAFELASGSGVVEFG